MDSRIPWLYIIFGTPRLFLSFMQQCSMRPVLWSSLRLYFRIMGRNYSVSYPPFGARGGWVDGGDQRQMPTRSRKFTSVYKTSAMSKYLFTSMSVYLNCWNAHQNAYFFFLLLLAPLKPLAMEASTEATRLASSTIEIEHFVECFLSGTRQSTALSNDCVYREQDSQHRNTLGKEIFAECQTLGERQRSTKGRQQPSKADGRYLCERRVLALVKEASLPSVLRLTFDRA
jgi:hypothetical protein